jgi:hypothetical protein
MQAARDARRPGRLGDFGPLNGQRRRQELLRDVLACVAFRAVVETGTYRGATAAFLHRVSGLPVHTVEANLRLFYAASRRFPRGGGVAVAAGDSRAFLRRLARDPRFPRARVLFYLDAHGSEDLPLADELVIVAAGWREWLAVVDDFEVPDDPGYGFDDFGWGQRLCPDLLPTQIRSMALFAPAAPSSAETGHRRGCVLIAPPGPVADAVAALPSVRPFPRA